MSKKQYSIELLRTVEAIRESIRRYTEVDRYLKEFKGYLDSEGNELTLTTNPLYIRYKFLEGDTQNIGLEIEKNIEGYQNLINESIIPNLYEKGELIEIESDSATKKDVSTLSNDIKNINKLFIYQADDGTKLNYLEEFIQAGTDTKKVNELLNKLLLPSDIDSLEKRTLTKSSMEFVSWKKSLEDLKLKVPEGHQSKIQEDLDKLSDPKLTPEDFVEIFKKYHYENVLSGKDNGANFPFEVNKDGGDSALGFSQKGSGAPDICLLYKVDNELYGVHSEPSNTPLEDVSRFENNSLIRHRGDIKKEMESHGVEFKEENILSQHIFLIDSLMQQVEKVFDKDTEDYLKIRTVITMGLEFLAKIRISTAMHEDLDNSKDEYLQLTKNRNIVVTSLDGNGEFYNKNKLEEYLKKPQEILKLMEDLFDESSKARKRLILQVMPLILYTMGKETNLSSNDEYNYLKSLSDKSEGQSKTLDAYSGSLINWIYHEVEKTKQRDEKQLLEDAMKWGAEMVSAGSFSHKIFASPELLLKEYKNSIPPKTLDKQGGMNQANQIIAILARSENSEKLIKSLEEIFKNQRLIDQDYKEEILSFNKEYSTISLIDDYNRAITEARDENKRLVNSNSGRNRSTSKGNQPRS